MERLKKLLRQAIQDQAQRLRLEDGQAVELVTAGGPRGVAGEGPVDAEYVHKLYAFLFPHDKAQLASGHPTKGALNVPNVGKILLIARPGHPASLRLYLPPQGPALFERDWAQLAGLAPAPGMAAPVAMAPPPPPSFAAPPPPVAAPVAAPMPMGGAMPPTPEAGLGGFVPLKFATDQGDTPVDAAPLNVMPNVPSMPSLPSGSAAAADPGVAPSGLPLNLGMPSGGPEPEPDPEPAPDMGFAPPPDLMSPIGMAPVMVAPQPIAEVAPPIAPMFAPDMAPPMAPVATAQPLRVAPPIASVAPVAPGVPEALPDISFSAEAPGSASISDGQNPIDPILIEMVKRGASDLHMTTSEPICFRLDGEIQRIYAEPLTPEQMQSFLLPLLPARNRDEFVKSNDTDFAYEIRGVGRFRVNIFRDRNGVGTVMRHIPSKILTAEQLNLPPAITKFCQLSKGLVVVTGPTGSGKSTTLAAMIDLINKTRHDHILTIEDPIEFTHPQQKCLVNQREVHKHTSGFSRALRAALREDPDIVLIGEMRDLETIAIAIETAETGHLVFGTLHTTTAVSTIDRIVDQFPTTQQEQIRMMLSSSLRGVVAQTLLKKKGGGRIAAHEILVTNDAVSAMVREGKNHMIPNHMQTQKADGNVLLNESLVRLVKENIVDADDAMRKAVDKNALLELYKRHGVKFGEAVAAPAPPKGAKQSA